MQTLSGIGGYCFQNPPALQLSHRGPLTALLVFCGGIACTDSQANELPAIATVPGF